MNSRRGGALVRYLPLAGLFATLAMLAAFGLFSAYHREQSAHDVERKLALASNYIILRNAVADTSGLLIRYSNTGDPAALEDLRNVVLKGVARFGDIEELGSEVDRAFVTTLEDDYLPDFELLFRPGADAASEEEPLEVPLAMRELIDERTSAAQVSAEEAVASFGAQTRLYSRVELAVMGITILAAITLALAVRQSAQREARMENDQRERERRALAQSERRFRALVQNSSDVIVVTNQAGIITYASPGCEVLVGLEPGQLTGSSLVDLVDVRDARTARRAIQALLTDPHGPPESRIVRVLREDGTSRHLEVRGSNLLEEAAVRGLVFNVRDVSERIAAAAAGERLSAVVEATRDLVIVAGFDGSVLDLNRTARGVLGVSGSANHTLFSLLPNHIAHHFVEEAIPAAVQDGSWEGEVRFAFSGAAEATVEVEIIAHKDGDNQASFVSCLLRDVTDRRRFEEQLSFLAGHDSLTGLPNRRSFEQQVGHQLVGCRQSGKSGALLIIDLDGLKTVNDDLGHLAGDELLRGSARIISAMAPAGGLAARIGGDEFAVLLPGADARLASEVAENVRLRLRAARFEHANEELSTTASIGVALYPHHGDDSEVILANADLAMYEAKTSRDACRIFRPDSAHRSELSERRIWEKRMRDALDQEAFVFMAQPLHQLDGGIVMYELLLRMEAGDGQLVRPSVFLPIAERSGLVNQIDRYVARKAIAMIAEAGVNGRTVSLAVNVSGRSLGDEELPRLVEGWLAESGIDPSLLVMEVTETAAIAGVELGKRFVNRLRALGVRVAIDDFGAGFSSFAYIKNLQVSHVKIDGSFIRNLISDAEDQHIVRTMIDLAHGLGKGVVAEFVENRETLELLGRFGVDMVQGYHLSRPARVELMIGVAQPGRAKAA